MFSKLILVKNELRSTMRDEILNSLMLMAVEKATIHETNLQIFVDTLICIKVKKTEIVSCDPYAGC